ncbi:MAG: VanZ family protein [Sandaracinaceae bacterium]
MKRGWERRWIVAWAPALLYMGLIWGLSSMTIDVPELARFPLRDKGIHGVEYGVLGFLLAHATLLTWPRHTPLRTAALAVLITVLWGVLDEIHQAFVPGRSPEVLDLVADTVGALLGTSARAIAHLLRRRVMLREVG